MPLLIGMAAAVGTGLCIEAVALREGWLGLLAPPLRGREAPGMVSLLIAGIVCWVVALAGSFVSSAIAPLVLGPFVGFIGTVIFSLLRPINPDSRFVSGRSLARESTTTAHQPFHIEPIDLSGDPDAGALLLEPLRHQDSGLVVLFHGGGNDRLCGLWLLVDELVTRGYAVLTAHLAGHGAGGSDRFSIQRCRDRASALVQVARDRTRGPVVLLGQSMGGAFVLDQLARGCKVDAALSVSAPVSLHEPMRILQELGTFVRSLAALRFGTPDQLLPAYGSFRRNVYPVRLETGDRDYVAVFRRTLNELSLLEPLRDIGTPLLVVHGARDGIVPVSQAVQIHDAAGAMSELRCLPGLHHLDVLLDPQSVSQLIDWVDVQVAGSRRTAA